MQKIKRCVSQVDESKNYTTHFLPLLAISLMYLGALKNKLAGLFKKLYAVAQASIIHMRARAGGCGENIFLSFQSCVLADGGQRTLFSFAWHRRENLSPALSS